MTPAMRPRLIAAAVLLLLILVFVFQNTEVVDLQILFWTVTMSRVLMAILFLIIGMALGWLLCGFVQHRRHTGDKL